MTPHRAPLPQMHRDAAAFLPRVLRDSEFEHRGLLFGAERFDGSRLHWVVIDPRRHTMYVWRKTTASYPAAARTLGASVFSSGPFSNHAGGSPVKATVKVGLDLLKATASPRTLRTAAREALVRRYEARVPLGHVIGEHEGILEVSIDRRRVYSFGRRNGSAFDDYEILQGNPAGMTEAIGGLFRSVTDFEPHSANRRIRSGFWGLVPLAGNPRIAAADVAGAVEQGMRGLIVFVGGRANTLRLATLFASIGVKDAVQVDGGDSLMLGGGTDMRIGKLMPEWKRMLQCWGVQFQPEDVTEPVDRFG
jgi:hypothetical protein